MLGVMYPLTRPTLSHSTPVLPPLNTTLPSEPTLEVCTASTSMGIATLGSWPIRLVPHSHDAMVGTDECTFHTGRGCGLAAVFSCGECIGCMLWERTCQSLGAQPQRAGHLQGKQVSGSSTSESRASPR